MTHERPDAENTLAGNVPNYRVCWPSSYSKRWQSPHCNSYREEKEGGWACRTGEVYSLHERTEERENWMKERRDILTLYWKTSLLMKKIPIAGLELHCSNYSVFLSSYGNTLISAAPELRGLVMTVFYLATLDHKSRSRSDFFLSIAP